MFYTLLVCFCKEKEIAARVKTFTMDFNIENKPVDTGYFQGHGLKPQAAAVILQEQITLLQLLKTKKHLKLWTKVLS